MNNICNRKIKETRNEYISNKRGSYCDKRIIDFIPQRKSKRIIEKNEIKGKQLYSNKESSPKISLTKVMVNLYRMRKILS